VLYDLRMGTPLHKLREGHTDVVTDVAFHPMHPQVATACFDGHVRFFNA
jgi:WD40 repeat protein